ncbi:preprotein translocase subunit SecD [Methanobacterium veterum]|jgi:preprotein translocase subunit SecD|uniref:Protein-export membrane protein SecD n=1 Tax=Methanobacterium veterum TaxID=408577 RepID=A0A9E5A252_9EURY|nr:preprotein translocase subunit SecD [Methanobacterium veterum]MCZ3367449.1 preprotein translocase subunit SecD [Methanobacterium veterum]MCZ3373403.1 preprotein translocase subunit SecD [Methanobacterium veterum]
MSDVIDFLKDYRVIILVVLLIGSLVSISLYGVSEGLDLKGGSLVQIHLEKPVDTTTMGTVTTVLDKRLNVFGVSDIKVRASGDQDVIVEIAGVQPDQVAKIIGTPGKFEAKINNQTVITGADIISVKTYSVTGNNWEVPFTLSVDGAKKFAVAAQGKAGQPVDFYLDNQLISSPEIGADVANGVPTTDVQITGSNNTRDAAINEAKGIQAVLQSGSLPVSVSIAGIQGISAELGDQFKNGALMAGVLALIVVAIIIFIRYKRPILVLPIVFTSIAELIIILGAASIIHWEIDLAAIAGIIAAIGTGVDDQIIITDEVLKRGKVSKRRRTGLNIKIKGAFFIIYASAATLIAAMIPLLYVGLSRGMTGIGLLSSFAFTTILGVLIGIFVTRPVYAKFIEKFVVTE